MSEPWTEKHTRATRAELMRLSARALDAWETDRGSQYEWVSNRAVLWRFDSEEELRERFRGLNGLDALIRRIRARAEGRELTTAETTWLTRWTDHAGKVADYNHGDDEVAARKLVADMRDDGGSPRVIRVTKTRRRYLRAE